MKCACVKMAHIDLQKTSTFTLFKNHHIKVLSPKLLTDIRLKVFLAVTRFCLKYVLIFRE